MAQPTARRNTPRKTKKQPDSRTKFDVWLESHVESGEEVTFIFKNDPLLIINGKSIYVATVFTVDRYHVYVEIPDFEGKRVPTWVAKDNIISAQ